MLARIINSWRGNSWILRKEAHDWATNVGQGIETIVSQITNVGVKGTDRREKVDPTLLKI